ncbi:hypothetical protein O3P69_005062 [Scylla paramamosain]|uniref:Ionotropic glutamate receptor C-terminal domain-containing protein n=1 Tax=Scylla paramamosain TaxID=85552 RepID=A0AAW0UAU7_SCYPA
MKERMKERRKNNNIKASRVQKIIRREALRTIKHKRRLEEEEEEEEEEEGMERKDVLLQVKDGQVGSGDGDVGVGNIFLDILRSRFATFSYPYTYEIACFITPAPKELPPWISLGSPFLREVWVVLVVTFLGAGVLSLFIARVLDFPKDLRMFYSLSRWLVYTVGIVTCRSQQMPQTNRLRVASLCLQFMGFVVAISFSGNLTAFLTTRVSETLTEALTEAMTEGVHEGGYEDSEGRKIVDIDAGAEGEKMMTEALKEVNVEPALRSLRQLDESGLTIVGFSNYWYLFFLASQNTHLLSFAGKYRDVADTLPVFREVAEQRTAALVENRNHLQYILTQFYTTKRGETPLRIQEECLATFGVSAALSRHSPLAPYINEAIHYMQAGGLTDKFFEEVLLQDLHHDDHGDEETWLDLHDQDTVATGAKVLSLQHLLGAFVVMAVGFLLASLSLAMEKCSIHSHGSTSH